MCIRDRVAERPRDGWRSTLHEALVGAGAADRLRAHLHAPVRRLRRRARQGAEPAADVPRRPGDGLRHRCSAAIGEDPAVGTCPGAATQCDVAVTTFAKGYGVKKAEAMRRTR